MPCPHRWCRLSDGHSIDGRSVALMCPMHDI
ncbi:MAG: Rieske 2Fe-2S domain-containing protein [Mycobacterium sp.]